MATAATIFDEVARHVRTSFLTSDLLVDIGEAPGSHLYHGRLG